jgi:hypothetical protein
LIRRNSQIAPAGLLMFFSTLFSWIICPVFSLEIG